MTLTAQMMMQALACLDGKLKGPVRLIMGGGGALLLAHHFTLSTSDIDAVPASGVSLSELDPLIKEVAKELSLAVDWINPYYSTFAHVLPADYGDRLVNVGNFTKLKVLALSMDDLLLMKCFAARQKDVVHARALVKKGASMEKTQAHIRLLSERKIPGCEKAQRFLVELKTFFAAKEEQ